MAFQPFWGGRCPFLGREGGELGGPTCGLIKCVGGDVWEGLMSVIMVASWATCESFVSGSLESVQRILELQGGASEDSVHKPISNSGGISIEWQF